MGGAGARHGPRLRGDPRTRARAARGGRGRARPSASRATARSSQPLAQETLDGVVDLVLVPDLAGDDPRLPGKGLLEVGLEAAAAVGGADLAEGEEVQLGQQVPAQYLQAEVGVAAVAVLPVREVEEVHVPRLGMDARLDDRVDPLVRS